MTPHPPSEQQTRRRRIDPMLASAGWCVVSLAEGTRRGFVGHLAVEEYPTDNGPADYALFIDGRVVGVVEAKRLDVGPQEVLRQAERYARGISSTSWDFDGMRVPFLYSSNGELIWHRDTRSHHSRSHTVARFHTPAALEERLLRDDDVALQQLCQNTNWHDRLRPYQIEANQAIEHALAHRKRQMLVAMATGTGKTFTMVNQVYRLMKSGVGKRILFLVDRRALAAQAVRAFASFEAEPGRKFNTIYEVYSQRFRRDDWGDDEPFDPKVLPEQYLTRPSPDHAFVYVCTIQRMVINLLGRNSIFALDEVIDEDARQIDIPIHAFDVLIADECHRGYTSAELSVWRHTFDHFDGIKIGLTATPAAHTTAYFKDIVFRYDYERAVREGYLVDYDVIKLSSNIRLHGLFLEEGDQVGNVDPETGTEQMDLLEDERQFDTSEIEQSVTSPESNRRILEELKRYTDEHEAECGRFPKTLIFATNDVPHLSHADRLVDMARDVWGRGEGFVQKITGRADRPLQMIREFRNRRTPGIVVTVDMLSTGVDIPDLEFIVFLRPVKSRILFEQMLGRGTRRGEHYPDKSHFTVVDCFDGTLLEYFREATAISAQPPRTQPRSITEIIEDIWANRDRDYNIRCLVKRLQRIEKEMSGEAREMFAAHLHEGDMAAYARRLPQRLRDEFTAEMQLLRDPSFQDLLINYPRKPRTFLVAYSATDDVQSEWLIRGADGREFRPDDYLQAFEEFIRDNPAQVEAIGILLGRPQEWSTAALDELRQKLKATPERFTIQHLQKAHELHYQKALVDIISMVKHAADEHKPLYTAAERVALAFDQVTAGRTFTSEQQQWLDRIRSHMIENLSIDHEDFDNIPILANAGGWNRANQTFAGRLQDIIRALNNAVAA